MPARRPSRRVSVSKSGQPWPDEKVAAVVRGLVRPAAAAEAAKARIVGLLAGGPTGDLAVAEENYTRLGSEARQFILEAVAVGGIDLDAFTAGLRSELGAQLQAAGVTGPF